MFQGFLARIVDKIPGECRNEDEIHVKGLSEQDIAVPFRPSFHLKGVNKILWSTVPKAALKSNRMRRVTWCLFMFVRMSL